MNWIRKCELKVGGLTFLGGTTDITLRTTFQVTQVMVQTPGLCNFKLFNPSRATQQAALALQERTAVELYAGYVNGNYGRIFKGNLRQVRVGKDNPTDTFVNIIAADELGQNWSTVSKTLPAKSTGSDLFDALAQAMAPQGVTVGYKPAQALAKLVYPRGLTLFGPAAEYLRTLGHSINATWCIAQGQLQMVPLGDNVPGGPWQINVSTGMVGMPVQTLEGIIVRTLINPSIGVNSLIQLNNDDIQQATESFQIGAAGTGSNPPGTSAGAPGGLYPALDPNGLYRVLKLEWMGDTRGQPWYQDMWTVSQTYGVTKAQTQAYISGSQNGGVYLGRD